MNIAINRVETCEAGKLLGFVNLTLELGDSGSIHISDIRIVKSENGPDAMLAPEFASLPKIFNLSPALYEKILAAAVDAYKVAMAQIAAEPPKPMPIPSGSSTILADIKAEREAYFAKYPAHSRTPEKWKAFRREWAERKRGKG